MTVKISVQNSKEKNELVDPIKVFGASHGSVWQEYAHGKPQKCYLIGAGNCESPIFIWWDDESNQYRLSSLNEKELKEYLPHIKFRKIYGAKIEINLIL